jgi:hypothetical protein
MKKQREEADQILLGAKFDKMTIEMLDKLVSIDMFLDKFHDIMGENMKEEDDGIARTNLQAFLNAINADNFPELLKLFETHHSRLIHAKLSVFVYEALQSARAKAILEKLIQDLDVKSLSLAAYAMSFTTEVPADIYPYTRDTHDMIRQVRIKNGIVLDSVVPAEQQKTSRFFALQELRNPQLDLFVHNLTFIVDWKRLHRSTNHICLLLHWFDECSNKQTTFHLCCHQSIHD